MALTYGIAWMLWLPLVLGPGGLHLSRYDASVPIFVSLGTTGPMLSSFVTTRIEQGRWAMPSNFFPPKGVQNWMNLFIGPALITVAFVVVPYTICVASGHKIMRAWPIVASIQMPPTLEM